MAKLLRCGDLMSHCDTVIHGKDETEVIGRAEEHARKAHNMTVIPPSVLDDIVTHIEDGPEEPGGLRSWFRRS